MKPGYKRTEVGVIPEEWEAVQLGDLKPFVTSGIRIGSPAITTRGFKEEEAVQLSNLIADVLDSPSDAAVQERVSKEVGALTARLPVYRQ